MSLVVQPTGVVLDPEGPLEVVVRAATFQGGHTELALEALDGAGPPLQADVASATALAVGEVVRVRIEPDAVVVVAP